MFQAIRDVRIDFLPVVHLHDTNRVWRTQIHADAAWTCFYFTIAREQDSDAAVRQRFAQKVGASGGSSNPAAISHEYHRRQLADFVEAIETGRPPLVDGKEGRKAVEIILGIYESARTGRAVELPR